MKNRLSSSDYQVAGSYFSFVGAIIRQAILDYINPSLNSGKLSAEEQCDEEYWNKDARDFLFTNRLEDCLQKFGMVDYVTVDKIRDRVQNIKRV